MPETYSAKSVIISLLLGLFLIPLIVSAAVFVKYDGVDGESQDSEGTTSGTLQIQSGGSASGGSATEEGTQSTSVDLQSTTLQKDETETTDKNHKGEIDIESWGAGATSDGGITAEDDWETPVSSSDEGDPDRPIINGAVPSTTGIEHEDIGITGDDDDNDGSDAEQAVQYRETDLDFVTRISSPNSALQAIFIKFDDIKGESQDDASGGGQNELRLDDADGGEETQGGNAETTWKVEKGEKAAKKPKEIVVVGSKVRGWDPQTKEELVGVAPDDPEDVANLDDLGLFVARNINDDENVHDVTMTENSVVMEYDQPGRLLGFIPAQLRTRTTVTFGDGERGARVKVKFPWYSFLYRKGVSASDVETALLPEIDDEVLVGFENGDPRVHARAFQTLSTVMKTMHDTAMAIIRKIG